MIYKDEYCILLKLPKWTGLQLVMLLLFMLCLGMSCINMCQLTVLKNVVELTKDISFGFRITGTNLEQILLSDSSSLKLLLRISTGKHNLASSLDDRHFQ